MLRFIVYSLLFYFVLKAIKIVFRYFNQVSHKEKPNVTQGSSSKNKINRKDIIDAEFEEISDNEDK